MTHTSLRPILAPLVGAAICFLLTPQPRAATKDAFVAHYVGRAISVLDNRDAGRIDIYIERWSPDDHRERLIGALKTGPATLLPALDAVRHRVGVLMMPGVQGAGPRVRSPRPRNLLFTRQRKAVRCGRVMRQRVPNCGP